MSLDTAPHDEVREFDVHGAGRLLAELQQLGVLSAIDRHLGDLLLRLETSGSGLPAIAGALASRAVQAGHVCLDLPHLLGVPLLDQDEQPLRLDWPALEQWTTAFEQSPLCTTFTTGSETTLTALRVDERHRVFLQRYGDYQQRLLAQLRSRASSVLDFDEALLADGLNRYFGRSEGLDAQRLAALLAVRNALTVISGGPGTGKTTTVGKILLLLQEQAVATRGAELRTLLLAPTGKAAQRLSESLANNVAELDTSERLRAALPRSASTIHRALGYQSRSPTHFARNAERPLSADVVLVDEASMVDLSLMTKLVEAVPKDARLILLGDKDQLASVEAGAIFGDIFRAAGPAAYSVELSSLAARLGCPGLDSATRTAPVRDRTVHLHKSYRYRDDSGIGRLARALRDGNLADARRALEGDDAAVWVELPPADDEASITRLSELITSGFSEYARAETPERRLECLDRFRILAAHRRGRLGVQFLNRLTEQTLVPLGLSPTDGLYDGRAIMITQNDYQQELFNGDVGVVAASGSTRRLAAYFRSSKGLRRVQLSRLPAHETVFAMTVHKSQGSEFEQVALVLPEHPSPVFTRELMYTGVTRAKRRVLVCGTVSVLAAGVATPVVRSSGLADGLQSFAEQPHPTAPDPS